MVAKCQLLIQTCMVGLCVYNDVISVNIIILSSITYFSANLDGIHKFSFLQSIYLSS